MKDAGFDVFVLNPLVTHAGRDLNVRNIHNDKYDSQKIALYYFLTKSPNKIRNVV